ncbi:MAG: dTDP-4-amino-4,6-dideoxygalactose transaminase [Magnetococcales bacterium]|nr:dTDP-4-amino-4,6-dideoxygalactose transaminase [Magnetococcales bacterium]
MVSFNKPYRTGKELDYIGQACASMQLAGDGPFSQKCHAWLEKTTHTSRALLTHSCTGALEMAAILAEIGPGDEVIMPSFTFVSTANAFALRGARPVFVDIRPDTLNLDAEKIEEAITSRTKAIVPVHYAGVGCDMDRILAIANRHNLLVIEDAAHSLLATYKGKALGTFGALGTLSFHETKNIHSGVGGALLINDPRFITRAEIIREKGTNRSMFFRGQVDKYTWCDIGSSLLPGEIMAAFLFAQMEEAHAITQRRLGLWHAYHDAFARLETLGKVRRPVIAANCTHNAHMYYLLLKNLTARTRFISFLAERGVQAVFHYVPLHTSPMGTAIAQLQGSLHNSESLSDRLVRLPLYVELSQSDQQQVIQSVHDFFDLPTGDRA